MPDGTSAEDFSGEKITVPIRYTGEGGITIRGSKDIGVIITSWPEGSGGISGYRQDGIYDAETRKSTTPILRADNATGEWNRLEIRVIGKRIKVLLNGKQVVQDITLEDLPERGPIGIHVPDLPLEFANIYIHEL